MKEISKSHTQGKGQDPILITAEGHHHLLNMHFSNIHISRKSAKYQSLKYVNIIISKKLPSGYHFTLFVMKTSNL